MKQSNPVEGLTGFFQGNIQLGAKISAALGVLRLGYIGTDAGSTSENLPG